MNRKQFILSHGATCKNWTWSWSFVNPTERFIIFGAWDHLATEKKEMIFSKGWKSGHNGKKKRAYKQSREHIRLIEEEGYRLFTFVMKHTEKPEGNEDTGPEEIGKFFPELRARTLTRVGDAWYAGEITTTDEMLPEELPQDGKYFEGAKRSITINAYERNGKARAACVAHHGYCCAVCEFDFQKVFGDLGAAFVHVHHIKPIGEIGALYEIDPVNELIPVCPNCHAMIHRVTPPLSIEALKNHIAEQIVEIRS